MISYQRKCSYGLMYCLILIGICNAHRVTAQGRTILPALKKDTVLPRRHTSRLNFSAFTPQVQQQPPVPDSQCAKQSAAFLNYFRHKEHFIPGQGSSAATVPKVIRICFVVANPDNTKKANFSKEDIKIFDTLVMWLNTHFSNTEAPFKPKKEICGSCHIPDTRIQFQLMSVRFYEADSFTFYKEPDHRAQMTGADSVLHIFVANFRENKNYYAGITNPGGGGIGSFAFGFDPLRASITIANTYKRYLDHDWWSVSVMLMHEMFHEFSLDHLWTSNCREDQPDYLTDIFGTGDNQSCPQTGKFGNCHPSSPDYNDYTCDNNVLAIRGYTWASPMQIGIIHRECFMGRMHRYAYPAERPDMHPWRVDSSQTWDFPIRLFQDVIVASDVTLQVRCKVEMPAGSRFILETGARLIVDGGIITSYTAESSWKGPATAALSQRQQKKGKQPGNFALVNGGKLENTD